MAEFYNIGGRLVGHHEAASPNLKPFAHILSNARRKLELFLPIQELAASYYVAHSRCPLSFASDRET